MDTLLEFLPYAIIAFIFYHVGSHVRAIQFSLNLSKDPDRFIEMMQKIKAINEEVEINGAPEDAHLLELEEVNGQVYAYDKLTGEFLAQAPNGRLAAVAASTRYPGKKFWHPSLNEDSQTA